MSRFIKYTLWIIASLLLIVAIQTAWYEFRVWRGWKELYATAEQFGYTPEAEIVASRSCYGSTMWIPPSTECEVIVVFQTDASLTEFQKLLTNQGIDSNTIGGTNSSILISEINRSRNSNYVLTLDGADGKQAQSKSKFYNIPNDIWFKRLSKNVLSTISFFDLRDAKAKVELNIKTFTSNIVIITLDVGIHSSIALLLNPNNFPYQLY